MSQSQVEAIIERWLSDESFRTSMRAAPIETIEKEGYSLSDEERQALQRMDFSQSDEELASQANFGS